MTTKGDDSESLSLNDIAKCSLDCFVDLSQIHEPKQNSTDSKITNKKPNLNLASRHNMINNLINETHVTPKSTKRDKIPVKDEHVLSLIKDDDILFVKKGVPVVSTNGSFGITSIFSNNKNVCKRSYTKLYMEIYNSIMTSHPHININNIKKNNVGFLCNNNSMLYISKDESSGSYDIQIGIEKSKIKNEKSLSEYIPEFLLKKNASSLDESYNLTESFITKMYQNLFSIGFKMYSISRQYREEQEINMLDFIVYYAIFSSQQRASQFEKSLGIQPFYYLQNMTVEELTKIYNIKTNDDDSYNIETLNVVSNINDSLNTRLFQKFVFLSKRIYDTKQKTSTSFYNIIIDKIYARCTSVSNEPSKIFDQKHDNANIMEHYVSKFAQISSKICKKKHTDPVLITFDFILDPTVLMTALTWNLLTLNRFSKSEIEFPSMIKDDTLMFFNQENLLKHLLVNPDSKSIHDDFVKYFESLDYENLSQNDFISQIPEKKHKKIYKNIAAIIKTIKQVISSSLNSIFVDKSNKDYKIITNIHFRNVKVKVINTPLDYKIDRFTKTPNFKKSEVMKSGGNVLNQFSNELLKTQDKQDVSTLTFFEQEKTLPQIHPIKSSLKDYFSYTLKISESDFNGRFVAKESSFGRYAKIIGFKDSFDVFPNDIHDVDTFSGNDIIENLLSVESISHLFETESDSEFNIIFNASAHLLSMNVGELPRDEFKLKTMIIKKIRSLSYDEILQFIHIIDLLSKFETTYKNIDITIYRKEKMVYSDSISNLINDDSSINTKIKDKEIFKNFDGLTIIETQMVNYLIQSFDFFNNIIIPIICNRISSILDIWKYDFKEFQMANFNKILPSLQSEIPNFGSEFCIYDKLSNTLTEDAMTRLSVMSQTLINFYYQGIDKNNNMELQNRHDHSKFKILELLKHKTHTITDKTDDKSLPVTETSTGFFNSLKSFFGYKTTIINSDQKEENDKSDNNESEDESENESSKEEKLEDNNKGLSSSPTSTISSFKPDLKMEFDEIDLMIDELTLCGFFKDYVLLSHGFNTLDNVNDVGLFEQETFCYADSMWNEIITGSSANTIVSPIKGLVERFVEEFRDFHKPFFKNDGGIYSADGGILSSLKNSDSRYITIKTVADDTEDENHDHYISPSELERLYDDDTPKLSKFDDYKTMSSNWKIDFVNNDDETKIGDIMNGFSVNPLEKIKDELSQLKFLGNNMDILNVDWIENLEHLTLKELYDYYDITKQSELNNDDKKNRNKLNKKWKNFKSVQEITNTLSKFKFYNSIPNTYKDGFLSSIDPRIGTGLECIKFTDHKIIQDQQNLENKISLNTLHDTGIDQKIIEILTHHIQNGQLFSSDVHNFLVNAYLCDYIDDPNLYQTIKSQDQSVDYDCPKAFGSIMMQNVCWFNYPVKKMVILDDLNGECSTNTLNKTVELCLFIVLKHLSKSEQSIMSRFLFSENQISRPELVPGDISISIHCSRALNVNYGQPIKQSINTLEPLSLLSDKNDILKNISERIPNEAIIKTSHDPLPIEKSLIIKMRSEYNIRKNIFDVACSGISSVIKHLKLPRIFLNKAFFIKEEQTIISNYKTTGYQRKKEEPIYFSNFNIFSRLKKHIWSFYETWYNEIVCYPQLFYLYSKKRLLAPNDNFSDKQFKSNFAYYDFYNGITKVGSTTKNKKLQSNQQSIGDALDSTSNIIENNVNTSKILDIMRSRQVQKMLNEEQNVTITSRDKQSSLLYNFASNLQYYLNDIDKNLYSSKLFKSFGESKENDQSNDNNIISFEEFTEANNMLYSKNNTILLHQQSIPSGLDISSFEHPYQCYSPVSKLMSKTIHVKNENSDIVGCTTTDCFDNNYSIPIFLLGKPSNPDIKDFFLISSGKFFDSNEMERAQKHNMKMNKFESFANSRLTTSLFTYQQFMNTNKSGDSIGSSFSDQIYGTMCYYSYNDEEIYEMEKERNQNNLIVNSNEFYNPYMNTGVSIVSTMTVVACLWIICMTAKLDSLKIYKPMDILKLITSKWIISSSKKKDYMNYKNNESNTSNLYEETDSLKTPEDEEQLKILTINEKLYDLFPIEFTGISQIISNDITQKFTLTKKNEKQRQQKTENSLDSNLLDETPLLDTEPTNFKIDENEYVNHNNKIKEAINYFQSLPNMYRQHTGCNVVKSVSKKEYSELDFIRESQDTNKRNKNIRAENSLSETIANKDETFDYNIDQEKKLKINILAFVETIEDKLREWKEKDDNKMRKLISKPNDGTSTIQISPFLDKGISLFSTLLSILESSNISEKIDLIDKQLTIVRNEAKLPEIEKNNLSTQQLTKDVQHAEEITTFLNQTEPKVDEEPTDKKFTVQERNVESLHQNVSKKIIKEIVESKDPEYELTNLLDKLKKEVSSQLKTLTEKQKSQFDYKLTEDDILRIKYNNDDAREYIQYDISTHLISVVSILYSSIMENEKLEMFSYDIQTQKDSLNIIYCIIKIMESAGFMGNVLSRQLDTGSGLTGNSLLNGDSTYFKDLLEESISTKSNLFWDCFSSKGFEVGIMDSLISNQ